MTQKPEQRENENDSPNTPETNEEMVVELSSSSNTPSPLSLVVGQQVDVLDSVNYWTEAEIVKIDEENKKLFVSYLFWSSKWDEWVDNSPERVALLHTHTYNPPNPLKVRQRVEVFGLGAWKEAFVVEENETQVKVHYRNVPFQHDEWIDRKSDRIRRFGPFRNQKNNKKWSVPVMSNSSTNQSVDSSQHTRHIAQLSDKYEHYVRGLERFKLRVHNISGDGNCLFRSVSHQIYGDDSHHLLVRARCMDYMEINSAFFSQFVIGGMETFHLYLDAKRKSGCWGDDPEIQAMCEIYDRSAQIYAYDPNVGARCLRTFHEVSNSRPSSSATSRSRPTSGPRNAWWNRAPSIQPKQPIRLSYYGGGHYDSLESTGDNQSTPMYSAPGALEDRAISRALERARIASNSDHHLEEAKRSSDVDATEMAELELALEVSRKNLRDWNEDLDSLLSLSRIEDGNPEYKEGSDLPPQLLETQHQILQTAVEESEREYLEKAIEESIKSASNFNDLDVNVTEASLLETAYQASLSEEGKENQIPQEIIQSSSQPADPSLKLALELSELSEEEIMARVLRESLQQQPTSVPSSRAVPTLATAINEEAQLQEAIRMSMLNSYHQPSSIQDNSEDIFYHNVDLSDDPELELAIQASYRDMR